MFIVFLLLIVGPIVASKFLKSLPSIPMNLLQPTGLNNNDTTNAQTGSALNGDKAAAATSGGSAATSSGSAATSSSSS